MKRSVREDQHGTKTGYVYGCRCVACCDASRAYTHANAHKWSPSPETLELIYQALEREADMDGLCTAGENRLGELAGLSGTCANTAVHKLAEQGRVRIVGRVGRVLAVQIGELA